MSFNLTDEINKLVAKVNDPKLTFADCFKGYKIKKSFDKYDLLSIILKLSFNYPILKENLEELLQEFSIDELHGNILSNGDKKYYGSFDIITHTIHNLPNISLDAIKLLVQKGVDFNKILYQENVLLYVTRTINICLQSDGIQENEHIHNIIEFIVSQVIDLNYVNHTGYTFLDCVCYDLSLTSRAKKFIELLIDNGANITDERGVVGATKKIDDDVLEFINSYKCLNIKRAIKK